MASERPYLSLVVTARNDDHGGDLLGRMQVFVSGWIAQARRHGLASELIIVEWNPVPDRPRLREALVWPGDFGPCEVRFIEVSPELHRQFRHAEALPLYQMIAKNVGIRRARGEFVLATNIDILFSDELVAFLAERRLDPHRMYRIDRHDSMGEVPVDASIDAQLEYCQTHLLRLNGRDGTFPLTPDGRKTIPKIDIVPAESGIAFGGGWFPVEQYADDEVFRWAGGVAEIDLRRPRQRATLCFDMEPGPGMGQRPMTVEFSLDELPMAVATIDRRSTVRISLPDGADVRALRMRVPGEVELVENDARALCFRAFSCRWETGAPRGGRVAGHIVIDVKAPAPAQRARWFARQLKRLLVRVAEGGALVTVTLPVSRPLKLLAVSWVRSARLRGIPSPTAPPLILNSTTHPALLHTNACGDFTLLARPRWFDLRGYPEFDLFSMHIDALFCYAAHYGGVSEELLGEPMRIYHIEHGVASGWTPEGEKILFERLRQKGIAWLTSPEVVGWAGQMRRLDRPFIFNHENWGLEDFTLPETVLPRL